MPRLCTYLRPRWARLLPLLLAPLLPLAAQAQLTLTATTPVGQQSFDAALGTAATAPLPAGFQLASGPTPTYGNAANTTTTGAAAGTSGTGALTATSSGNAYNFAPGVTASSTDRALGFLSTGSYASPRHILLAVLNSTGQTVTDLAVAFDIEKYRAGTRAFDWQLYTSPDGTTWTLQPAGSQTFAADPANAVVNPPTSVSKSLTLTGLNLADGATTYLRWSYVGNGGSTNGQGLGLDNLVLTPTLSTAPPAPTLTTGTIPGSPFCVTSSGAAVSVPFTSSGGLTGTFAAQLSDATGTFPTDLTQNLIGSGSASPIAATIPAGTPAGTGYRIRVVHAGSSTVGSANGSPLTVTTPPSSNSVTLNPTAAQSFFTTGTGTALTATASAPSTFTWAYATSATGPFTTNISGATAATYTPRGADFGGTAGTYYLVAQATSTCGSVTGTSAPVSITLSVPQPTLTATPNPVPDFGSVVVGTASAGQSVNLSGSNLPGDLTLTPPAGFQLRTGTTAFSCAPLTLPVSNGSLSATVEVRFVPTLAQASAGTITATSGAASLPGIQVSGAGTSPAYPASVSTTASTAITTTTATSGGQVLEDGGSPVTARGVVYATTEAPTTQDDFTTEGAGLGSFTSPLTGLLPNTTYYVRAYATNAQGTSYGQQVSFTTAAVALAAEPTQASTLTATTVTSTTVTLSISGGDGAKQLLVVTPGPALSFQPTDGITYAASPSFGQGDQPAPTTYVVLAGAAASVTVTGLQANAEYTFAVYDYNDNNTSGAENYLLSPRGELTLSTPPLPLGLLYAENFDYPAGDRLTAHNWTAHSVAGTNPILVATPGLSFPGYADAGSPAPNGAAALTASGEDVSQSFARQSAGAAVYVSALVNVTTANAADYFLHLGPDPLGTTFRARLFVRAAPTAGKLQFGVSGSGTATQWDPTEYTVGQTYLVMVRYLFGPSGTETRLYVNPGSSEPTTANATSTEDATSAPANIGTVALRQGANTSPLLLDGLRIANSYSAARAFTAAPLPVTLTRFTARRLPAGSVQVEWATAQELNARTFQVQRSLDGRTFTTVATQAAAGTTSTPRQYQAFDAKAPAVQLYYRLQQQDQDGTLHYSSVVTIAPGKGQAPTAALAVAPNPAAVTQPLSVHVAGRAGQSLTLHVFDNAGRQLYTQPLRPATDAEQLPVQLPATLPAGTYLLRVSGSGTAPLHTRLVLTR